ncbi:MAG: hypothetical protein I8H75_04690 [Myxococcaceae bacterium]|nr:hypothetical protein [Myxococcaceae bacterium]MBH2006621.1 hypothetical protein [Myxococcaceae bacterium]
MKLSFLGPEFLTWLYFHLDHLPVQLTLGRRVVLKPLDSDEQKVMIASPKLEESGEFLQAVRAGAYVESISLDLTLGERVHSLALNALDGSLSGVKTNGLEKNQEDSLEADVLIRMSNLDEIEDAIKRVFEQFLEARLGQKFQSESVKTIRESVSEGLRAKLP